MGVSGIPFFRTHEMQRICLLLLLIATSGCVEHPDPTTSAIATADSDGGICSSDSIIFIADRAAPHYDCTDFALRDISQLVYNAPE